MERHYFGLATLLASVALLIWSIGETFAFPQGPNVSTGSNPIITIQCTTSSTGSDIPGYYSYGNPYQIPAGYDYVVTDMGADRYNPSSIQINNGNGYHSIYSHYFNTSGGAHQAPSWNTGLKVPSGALLRCQSNGSGFISGYLVHQ